MNKNVLNSIPIEPQKTNMFDLSHDLKFSFNMGYLVPTTVIDCVPGDSFTIGFENMLRFSALIAPIMHRVKVTTHYFFVPNRILWDDWEKWITGQLEVEPPYFYPRVSSFFGNEIGSLADYMGVPPFEAGATDPPPINALPFAAYWKIYYEYYMDQNNDPDFEDFPDLFTLTAGDNSSNGLPASTWYQEFALVNSGRGALAPRAWMHDYFTSALPWPQKGEDVFIPLSAPVTQPFLDGIDYPKAPIGLKNANSGTAISSATPQFSSGIFQGSGAPIELVGQIAQNTDGDGTITNLRRAFKLQEWLEKNARGGTRYTESILVHFGVNSSDKRLQRPEYLGGSVQNMVISEVLSTAQTLDSTDQVVNPVGQMSGHGISVGGSNVLRYFCEEHGWIIGLISVMPDTAYQDGIAKKFDKFDRFEYFWPTFQHIGDQAVKRQEVLFKPNGFSGENEGTFGYVPRYTEYKYENSRVAGDFRDTLDFWHLGRIFDNAEVDSIQLNERFIYPARFDPDFESSPFDRIFAVNSSVADTIYAHVLNKIKARRPMAVYGIPGI